MKIIFVSLTISGNKEFINPEHVKRIRPSGSGARVYFIHTQSINVEESPEEIKEIFANAGVNFY